MKVASLRLVETGFNEAIETVKQRKESTRQRLAEWSGAGAAVDEAGAPVDAAQAEGVREPAPSAVASVAPEPVSAKASKPKKRRAV